MPHTAALTAAAFVTPQLTLIVKVRHRDRKMLSGFLWPQIQVIRQMTRVPVTLTLIVVVYPSTTYVYRAS